MAAGFSVFALSLIVLLRTCEEEKTAARAKSERVSEEIAMKSLAFEEILFPSSATGCTMYHDESHVGGSRVSLQGRKRGRRNVGIQ
jgi:hypothetical protein